MVSIRTGPPKDPKAYAELVRTSVADIVRRQAAAGIDIVNDGEYGKSSWANYVLERMSGFEMRAGKKVPMYWLGRDRERFKEAVEYEFRNMPGTIQEQVCKGAIEYREVEAVLVCPVCRLRYEVRDDIPIMLIDDATSY